MQLCNALNASIRKEERSQFNNQSFYFKKIEKEEQISKQRKEIIKIKAPVITHCMNPPTCPSGKDMTIGTKNRLMIVRS